MPNIADFKSSLEAHEIESRLVGGVVFNADMSGKVSEEEKAIARNNIGATAFGQGIKIVSHYDTLAQLEAAVPKPKPGDAYSVGANLPYNLYIFDLLDGSWKDYGPIRSADISARLAQNVAVSSAAWEEDDAVFTDYHYKARIPLGEINGGDFAFVGFSPHDATAGNFSPICFSFDGAVEIWAKAIPDAAILIPSISFIVLPDNSGATSTKGITNACGGIPTGGIGTTQLADGAVTAKKLSSDAVTRVFEALIGIEWTGDTAPYTQEITVVGLPNSNRIFASLLSSDDWEEAQAEEEEFAKVTDIKAGENRLYLWAEEPTELPLNLKIFVFHGSGSGGSDDMGGTGGSGSGGGADGFSPIAKVHQTETGAVITITDVSGTTTASVSNGKDGVGIEKISIKEI